MAVESLGWGGKAVEGASNSIRRPFSGRPWNGVMELRENEGALGAWDRNKSGCRRRLAKEGGLCKVHTQCKRVWAEGKLR